MIKNFLILIVFTTVVCSCNDQTKKTPVTDIEVANTFVRNLLDNNFKEAEKYLLKDSVNLQMFETFQKQYDRQDKAVLEQYKNAYIIVNDKSYVTDSVFMFNYSNSYKPADKTILKLIRPSDKWLVDLKYTFPSN
ncbi:MAG: hypothetical protein ABI685_04895 [Ferruginibacter sp.]